MSVHKGVLVRDLITWKTLLPCCEGRTTWKLAPGAFHTCCEGRGQSECSQLQNAVGRLSTFPPDCRRTVTCKATEPAWQERSPTFQSLPLAEHPLWQPTRRTGLSGNYSIMSVIGAISGFTISAFSRAISCRRIISQTSASTDVNLGVPYHWAYFSICCCA